MAGIIPKKKRSISTKAPAFDALWRLASGGREPLGDGETQASRLPNAYPISPAQRILNAPIGALDYHCTKMHQDRESFQARTSPQ